MIKLFMWIGLLNISISINAQSNKDTLLKKGNFTDPDFQVVFIAPPRSVYHQKTIDLLVNGEIVKKDSFLTSQKESFPVQYSGEWLSIYKYKHKKYAYSPSEPYYNFYINIQNGGFTINDFDEGLINYRIVNVRRRNNRVLFTGETPGNEKKNFLIKRKRGFAIIQSDLFAKKKIAIAKKELFFSLPIIVNYCPFGRCGEFNFK